MNDITHMARLLRQRYEQKASEKIGRPYKLPEKFRKPEMWAKVAEACTDLKADPDIYMDAAFAECTRPEGPFASALAGPAAAYWYRSYREKQAKDDYTANPAEECMGAFEWSAGIMSEHISLRMQQGEDEWTAWHSVLSHPLLNIPPYVRVVMAYPSYPDVVKQHLAETLAYFGRYPTAAAVCAREFPLLIEILKLRP